jgi:hypothetical protein
MSPESWGLLTAHFGNYMEELAIVKDEFIS